MLPIKNRMNHFGRDDLNLPDQSVQSASVERTKAAFRFRLLTYYKMVRIILRSH